MSSLQKPASDSTGDEARAAEALAYLRAETAATAAPRRAQRKPGAISGAGGSADPLYTLRIRALWRFLTSQSASFWLVCGYVFVEYVRPQQIYESLNILPWGKISIGLALLVFLLEGNRIRFGLLEGLLAVFSLVIVASSVSALHPRLAFGQLWDWVNWLIAFVLIANTVTSEGRVLVFLLAYLAWNFKMAQSGVRSWAADGFAFRGWGAAGAPGWFSNSGEFAIQMVVFLPLVLAFMAALRKYWGWAWKLLFATMALSAVVCVVASSSRGGLVGLAVMGLWMLARSRYKGRALIGVAVLAGVVFLTLPPEQLERLRSSGDDQTSTQRVTYWKRGLELMQERPVFGIGYKNWARWHEEAYGRPALPHNIFIEAGAELGVTGVAAFLALIGGTLVVNARTRRLVKPMGASGTLMFDLAHALDAAMLGYLACGFFVTVLFYPYFWINLAMTAALHAAAVAKVAAGRAVVPQPMRRVVAAR